MRRPPPLHETELRRQHDLVAPTRDRLPDELLIRADRKISAVSMKVTPSSIARWMVRMDSASSLPAPP